MNIDMHIPLHVKEIAILPLTAAGKIALSGFSEPAISHAERALYKSNDVIEKPFGYFVTCCKRYSDDHGIPIAWGIVNTLKEAFAKEADGSPLVSTIIYRDAYEAKMNRRMAINNKQGHLFKESNESPQQDGHNQQQIGENSSREAMQQSMAALTGGLANKLRVSPAPFSEQYGVAPKLVYAERYGRSRYDDTKKADSVRPGSNLTQNSHGAPSLSPARPGRAAEWEPKPYVEKPGVAERRRENMVVGMAGFAKLGLDFAEHAKIWGVVLPTDSSDKL